MSNGDENPVKWDRGQFYELAMQPDFPDEMALQLDREDENNPATTFSMEAVDELAEQFRTFVMARIVGRSRRGVMPKHMRVNVSFDWNPSDPRIDPNVGPFWIAGDEGLTPIDGERRKWGGEK